MNMTFMTRPPWGGLFSSFDNFFNDFLDFLPSSYIQLEHDTAERDPTVQGWKDNKDGTLSLEVDLPRGCEPKLGANKLANVLTISCARNGHSWSRSYALYYDYDASLAAATVKGRVLKVTVPRAPERPEDKEERPVPVQVT